MSPMLLDPPAACQANSVVRDAYDEDKSLVLARLLRKAIDKSGWKDGAVAEAIGLHGASGAAYFSKMLAADKPITARHLAALPDDVEAIFAQLYAESFGLIVVAPLQGPEAVRALVAGLTGVLTSRLPERASGPVKAEMRAERRKGVA